MVCVLSVLVSCRLKMKQAIYCILFTVFLIITLAWALLAFRDYGELKRDRDEEYGKAIAFYNEFCKNPHNIQKYGLIDECKNKKKTTEQDPQLYALYDVLEKWSLCGKACDRFLDGFSWNLWKLALCLGIIYVIAMTLCGFHIRNMGRREHVDLYKDLGGYESYGGGKQKKYS
jgi:hypothetical protein